MNPQLPSPIFPVEAELADFPELWRTINRYRSHVLGIMLLFAVLGTLDAFSEEPIYRATATLLIEARPTRLVQVQEIYDPGIGSDEYYATQAELLRSRDLLGRVVDRLDLISNREILPLAAEPTLLQRLTQLEFLQGLPFLPAPEEPVVVEELPELKRERAIESLSRRISVVSAGRTQLMRVNVDAQSPPLAAAIANTLGEIFMDSGLESRLETTEHATRWLTQRLADLRSNLENSERLLQAYREKHQLVNVGGTRGLFEEELLDNSRKLREAQRRKTELASTYWKIQQAGSDDRKLQDISALLLDAPVQRASENVSQTQQGMKQLEERYGSKHPQMVTAQARLLEAQRNYSEQLRLAANGLKNEYEIATETERSLLQVVETGKEKIRTLDRRDYELRTLERESQTNRELHDLFLKRFKETDSTSTFEPLNSRIVDRAVVPRFPYKPKKVNIIMLWTLGGLLVGILLAALRHLLSETIRSPDQLEQLTQLPVLSVLPIVAGLGRKAKVSAPVLCIEHPRDPFPEGVRSIRASLFLSDVDRRMKRIMFTSAIPKEGKSSVASGFAVTMGQMERVVLVEADLRAPSQKKVFGIPKEAPGLVEVLTEQVKLEEALFLHAPSGIHVLPVAKIPVNPAEIIASVAFQKLIETLVAKFDRVVFDSPPCQVASDSLLLARQMDAVIFVIHSGTTGRRAIQTAVKHLRAAQAPLLGHVLNQVNPKLSYGYDTQYYGYGRYKY